MNNIFKWLIGVIIFALWFTIPLVGLNYINKLFDSNLLMFTFSVVLWLGVIFTIYMYIPNWWVSKTNKR